MSQVFHDEPVLHIKVQTYQPSRQQGKSEFIDELHIVYSSATVIVDGFSLYQALRAVRTHVARGKPFIHL